MGLLRKAASCTGMNLHRQLEAMERPEAIDWRQCRHRAVVCRANVPATALALTGGGLLW
jgi:hypothetical protein